MKEKQPSREDRWNREPSFQGLCAKCFGRDFDDVRKDSTSQYKCKKCFI